MADHIAVNPTASVPAHLRGTRAGLFHLLREAPAVPQDRPAAVIPKPAPLPEEASINARVSARFLPRLYGVVSVATELVQPRRIVPKGAPRQTVRPEFAAPALEGADTFVFRQPDLARVLNTA